MQVRDGGAGQHEEIISNLWDLLRSLCDLRWKIINLSKSVSSSVKQEI